MTPDIAQEFSSSLAGLRLLVVEDEMLLAMLLQDILEELGCIVVKAGRLAKAVEMAETNAFDGAILDVNLAGEEVYPVAKILKRRSIPFIFATGYQREIVPAEYRDLPVLAKPYLPENVEKALGSFAK